LLALTLTLPACLVAAVGVFAVALNNTGAWTWAPDRVSLSEAVATGNYAEVVGQIERGVDPNPPADVRAELLSGEPVRVTPLQAAVWGRNPLMVRLLLEHGAVVGPTALAVLKCMNDENGDRDVRALLDGLPSASAPSCSEVDLPGR